MRESVPASLLVNDTAWSEGTVYNSKKDLSDYFRKTSMEYDSPVQSNFIQIQREE